MQLQKTRARSWLAHVLVVEDEPAIREMLAEDLRGAGLAVTETASADEALRLYLSLDRIDLVFTDVQMPGSLDGLGLATRLSDLDPSLPVIVTSGAVGPESVSSKHRFIAKPYRLTNARSLVFSLLGLDE
jgi:CheY-like chemotaxis protein